MKSKDNKKNLTPDELSRISQLISKKIKKEVVIKKAEQFESGYHSDGFKLITESGEHFFLKRVKSHDLGFELPERKISSLLVSDGMGKRAGKHPVPIGVVLDNKGDETMLPDISEDTEIYHIQEFEDAKNDYHSMLQERKDKKEVDSKDQRELDKISDLLIEIHNTEYPINDEPRKKSVYNNGLRSLINHPELTIMFLHDFGEDHPILPISKQGEYLGKMMELAHKWKDRTDRLSALHGDFWGANLFFKEDDSIWLIDYSRVPWGDPGLDVGWWLSPYLWLYHETGNEYFKNLGEFWLDIYQEKTGDEEIREAVCMVLGLQGLIHTTPRFYPDLDVEVGKRFFDNIWEILDKKEFTWKT